MTKKKLALVALGYLTINAVCIYFNGILGVLAMSLILAFIFLLSSFKRKRRLKMMERNKRLQIEERYVRRELKRRNAVSDLITIVDYYTKHDFRKKQKNNPFSVIILQNELNELFRGWYRYNEELFPSMEGHITVLGVRSNEYLYRFPIEIEAYRSTLKSTFKTRA